MTAKNDITGDPLTSKPASDSYRSNWDLIFLVCKTCGQRKEPEHQCPEVPHTHDVKRKTGDW